MITRWLSLCYIRFSNKMPIKILITLVFSALINFTHCAEFDRKLMQEINAIPFDDIQPENTFHLDTKTNVATTNVLHLLQQRNLENTQVNAKIDTLSAVFKKSINRLKNKNKKIDVIFLIDSSSSVGKNNFLSEIKFVKKLLSDFNVSFNSTRVAIITFSSQGKVIRHVDQISNPSKSNDKCLLLNHEIPKIKFYGGGTFTYGALKKAKETFINSRPEAKKLLFLITDGFSNGKDPVPIAYQLKNDNTSIFSIGIQTGNYAELYNISSSPRENFNFLLDSFIQFESLARKGLHSDYKLGASLVVDDQLLCNVLCPKPANVTNLNETSCCGSHSECTCGTTSGQYACRCNPGYYGNGVGNSCEFCPNGTYWQSWNLCRPCPDINHITLKLPAISVDDCVCKMGFKMADLESNRCEVITCLKLKAPENGYFVKHPMGCGHVLNAACGARCKSGYQLVGSSIRLCQDNGIWSGNDANCVLKTCPSLPIPYYGLAICRNSDLDLEFDYSFRNKTFQEFYHNDTLRITEPMPIDTDCNFQCGPGFYLVGSPNRNCLPLSKWDGLQTTCKQILCSPLPSIKFGSFDPTDCDDQKQAHGSNCTVVCQDGFSIKGPAFKTCGGKRSGSWSQKNKVIKCIDTTPPVISCPIKYTVELLPTENFAVINELQAPNITDNSNLNVSFWAEPSIGVDGIKLELGQHNFSYFAMDAFSNKANCSFTIEVVDVTPPTFENCINPPDILISVAGKPNRTGWVDWDHPTVYDNSNKNVTVTQTLHPKNLEVGLYTVNYTAIDSHGNNNSCSINITVIESKCDKLSNPSNGHVMCAQNRTHLWCNIECHPGYGIYSDFLDEHVENLNIVCEHENPTWLYDPLPDCTLIELPDSVSELFSFTVDSPSGICDNLALSDKIQNELKAQLHEQMCQDQSDCEIVSEMSFCHDADDYGDDGISEDNFIHESEKNKTFYNIVKREVRHDDNGGRRQKKYRSQMRINTSTKMPKDLGIGNETVSRDKNVKNIKNEVKHIGKGDFKSQLEPFNVDLKNVKRDLIMRCKNGSVVKKHLCVQCPKGTFHSLKSNTCDSCPVGTYNDEPSQIICKQCPLNYSTRKNNSKTANSCREQCHPGTVAKVKNTKKARLNQKSLMPYCRKCQPGEHQPLYNQIACTQCPSGFTSSRGARDCMPTSSNACLNRTLCGLYGRCVDMPNNHYSCVCVNGYFGSHCERKMNYCLSSPCSQNAQCKSMESTFKCLCSANYTGELCEIEKNVCDSISCHNSGYCEVIDDQPVCECENGFYGRFCDSQVNYCEGSPCVNGDCVSHRNGYYCKCAPGFIGRRCHIQPCDYFPCPKNSNCIDVPSNITTRNSYRCVCPTGLKGDNCNRIDNPCDSQPCYNNGICTPKALRTSNVDDKETDLDVDVFKQFSCKCPPYFYGELCKTFVTPDFVLKFTSNGINDFVQIKGPNYDLTEVSFCVWLKTNDTFNYGVILSYASEKSDNMFTFTDYHGFVLYVNGNHVITDMTVNDGLWHFVCVTWTSENGIYEIYLDGKLFTTGINLSANSSIEGNGSLTIGQEQDDVGASFSETEAFIGTMSNLDIWNYTLQARDVHEYYRSCEPYFGNLIPWTTFKFNIKGNVQVLPSNFCHACTELLHVENGYARIMNNQAYYHCNTGYLLQGTNPRLCLRTSQWEDPPPYCRPIMCGVFDNPLNGFANKVKTYRGEELHYICREGYYLEGSTVRVCQSNGSWTGILPECRSKIHCDAIKGVENSLIYYASDKGPLDEDLEGYPIGSLAEIQCVEYAVLFGESMLTCLENGKWDYSLPECKLNSSNSTAAITDSTTLYTEELTSIYETDTSTTQFDTTSVADTSELQSSSTLSSDIDDFNWDLIINTINELNYNFTVEFFQNLREYYFYGCGNRSEEKSVFCNIHANASKFDDLNDFEHPNTTEFENIDEDWLNILKSGSVLILMNENITKPTSENMLDFLLANAPSDYGERLSSKPIADTFRLYFCFYIDSIILENKYNNFTSAPVTNLDKIQLLVGYLIAPLYNEYISNLEQDNLSNFGIFISPIDFEKFTNIEPMIKTTEKNLARCKFDDFVGLNLSALVHEVHTVLGIKTFTDYFTERTFGAEPGEKLNFICPDGYKLIGDENSVCRDNGTWSNLDLICQDITCVRPSNFKNMIVEGKEDMIKVGDVLDLKCVPGYSIHGNAKIECLPNAKWSKIVARCLKITCNRPRLPPDSSIISERSYLYQDKVTVQCSKTKKQIDIECASDGNWQPALEC